MSSSASVQLTFSLRTSASVRSVHLVGSWDNYASQLPLGSLSAKDASVKPGSWRGTFRFQASHALKAGQRYWYYYIIDGYHVSHDPAKESVVEKTTGRKLNILDIPAKTVKVAAPVAKKPILSVQTTNLAIPQGRSVSPSRIFHPKPQKPHASRAIREADYETSPVDELEARFAAAELSASIARYSPAAGSAVSASSEASGSVFSASPSNSSCSDDEEDSYAREAELKRRALARLHAQRSQDSRRNGIVMESRGRR